jgi:DNA-binding beta-propeller fold protein YncE
MKKITLPLVFVALFFTLSHAQQPADEHGNALPNSIDNPVVLPLAGPLGELSTIPAGDEVEGDYIGEMKFTRNGEEVWVLNRATNNISVINWGAQIIIHDIPVGDMPMDIDFSENYAVVPCHFSHDVYFISLQDYSVKAVKATSAKPAKVHVSQGGNIAVVGCDENDVAEVFDLNTFEKILTIPDFPVYLYKFAFITSNPRNSVYFSNFRITHDEAYVANGAGENGLQFWDLATGALTATIPEAGNSGQIELSVDGSTLVAMKAANPGVVTQVDVASQSFLKQISIPTTLSSSFSPPAVNANGRKALVPTLTGGNTALIDFETETWQYVNTGNTPDWVGRNEDGSLFIAGDYYLAVIDAETGAILSSLNGTSIQNGAIGKGNRIVATDPLRYESVQFYKFENPTALTYSGKSNTGSYYEADATYSVKFTPDEQKLLAVNSLSGSLSVIDLETEQLEYIKRLGNPEVFHIGVTANSKYVLAPVREEDQVKIVDLETSDIILSAYSGGSKPDQIFISPGGNLAYVLNAGGSDQIGVFDLEGATPSYQTNFFTGNTGVSWINYGLRSDLKYTTDGYALLATPFDQRVQLIDLAQHKVIDNLLVEGFPLQIAITPDETYGHLAAVTLKDGNAIALFSGQEEDWQLINTYPCGHNPTRIDFDPLYRAFWVVANDDLKIQQFSLETFAFEDEVFYPDHTPLAVRFDQAGRRFTLLRSLDADYLPHRLEVVAPGEAPVFYDLASLPGQYLDLNSEGALIAIPHPATDEVTLLRETPLGYEQTVISTRPQPYRLFPNPVAEALHFQQSEGNEPISDVVFRLFDANGKVLAEQNCGGTSFSIQRQAGWTAGSYFYEIRREGERVQSGKVMLR